jgi:tetratricopeptide (TPR) repeat protein
MGNVAGAGRVCRKLIDLNPDNENRYLEAGVLYERFGPADSLVSIYEEGLRANPEFYRLHYRLGAHYRRIRNDGKASHHFASVVRILESSGRPLTPEEQNLLASLRGGTQGGP